MTDLLIEIKARLKAILAGSVFEDPAGGTTTPMVEIGFLPPKRSGSQQNDEDFPFVLIRPIGGESGLGEELIIIKLKTGIWTSGDILSGITAVNEIREYIKELLKNRTFTPYRLALPITWKDGVRDNDDEAPQPHPYYVTTFNLLFKRAPQATSRR